MDGFGATFSKAFAVVTPRRFQLEIHLLSDAYTKVFCAISLTWGMVYGLCLDTSNFHRCTIGMGWARSSR